MTTSTAIGVTATACVSVFAAASSATFCAVRATASA
jgi:hypothetical protein